MSIQPLYAIILAAGKGTRMKSAKAKVLHEAFYAPMLHHVLRAVAPLKCSKTIVIVGHQRDAVVESLGDFGVETALQTEQLGTGHAVLCAEESIPEKNGSVMILCGDTPLIRSETLQAMYDTHCKEGATLTVMTTVLDDPTHYGRIISDSFDNITRIVEEKDATRNEKAVKEINAGIYCIETDFLFQHLKNITTDNSQGEVYLTDIVTQAVAKQCRVQKFFNSEPNDVLGVNARFELSQAHQQLQDRRNRSLMDNGVTMIQPETIQVAPSASIDADVTIHPGVEITGRSSVGTESNILQGVILHDVTVGKNVTIKPYTCLEGCTIDDNSVVNSHDNRC